MKYLFLFLFIQFYSIAHSEINIKLYHEQTQNGFTIYADNDEYCPVSIHVNFSVNNLKTTDGNKNIYVIPAKSKRHPVTTLNVIKKGKSINLGYQYTGNYGDANIVNYDKDFEYFLPFKKGATYAVWQGYNGHFSHKNENALDFTMPVGTEIFSVREGIVVKVVDNNKRHCDKPECAQYNNYILVCHPDGTFADYAHIKHDGAAVKVGDKVEAGQLIAYSGNVGYSSGPHLHLAIYLPKISDRITLETKFRTGDGVQSVYLKEKESYFRDY